MDDFDRNPDDLASSVGPRDIAVVGLAGRFPGARDLGQFWRNLRDGVEGVTTFSDEELAAAGVDPALLADPRYVKAGSVLDGVEEFDAGFFGYTAHEAEIMDPQQRLFLEHCWEALENAGYHPARFDGLIGVYAGVAWNTYLLTQLRSRPELFAGGGGFQVFITNDKDFMPTRVSYKLNLKGPSVIVQTSCSTSLVAIHLACLSLLNYECDMALAGGATVKVPQKEGYLALEGGLASPDGHCRAFDAGAQGTIFGSGVGVVVLKRLAEALEDGDHIHAVIKGSAINNDGSVKVSYTAPSVEGQAEVVAAALAVAGVDPETIRAIEAHGTGTSLGDPIEVAALTKVFRTATDRRGFCALGSVKTNVGHLDAAAGVAGFLKTVLALENRQIPPSLNFSRPNPKIDFESSPFYVSTRLADWPAEGHPRRAGVSSFGVGGTNAHVILEEAPPAPAPGPSRPWQLLALSARSDAALDAATANLARFLAERPDAPLADVAWTLQMGRATFRHRRVLIARDAADAAAALAARDPGRVLTAVDSQEPRERPVAFLFPGQGTQHVNMGLDLYREEPVFREEVDRCADLLRLHLGLDLREVLYPAGGATAEAEKRLERTGLAQPALFTVEYALARLWMSWGVEPRALVGHSVGEYVAATLAGVFSLPDALALVAARGRLMDGLPGGAMLSVPLPESEVAPLLGAHLSLAAVNEPERCVVSGPLPEIEDLEARLAAREISGRRLHTSHAFHSAMMDPVLDAFTARVREVRRGAPQIPWISNVTGRWIEPEQATDPAYWARQLRGTVRFADAVQELVQDPERILLEVGPGRTLSTFARRAGGSCPVVPSMRAAGPVTEGSSDQALLLEALGRLWMAGAEIDWRRPFAGERRRRLPLPTYPFERQRYWIEARREEPGAPAAPEAAEAAKRPDPAGWFYAPAWTAAAPPRPALPGDLKDDPRRRWLLFADGRGLASGLAERLAREGREVVLVTPGGGFSALTAGRYEIAPGRREDHEALLEALEEAGRLPDAVIHAWSVTGAEAPSFAAAQERGFHDLMALAQALAGRDLAAEVWVLSDGLHRITGGEALAPAKATILAPCRIIPQEIPGVACQSLDVDLAPGTVDRVLSEIAAGPSGDLVAWRGGRRWRRTFEPLRLEADGRPLRPLRERGVYLVTGGLEGNGFGIALALAGETRARLVLQEDPAGAPSSERRAARIARLEAAGAEVEAVAADLADEAAVTGLVARALERFGEIHGVVHAAGVVGERTFRPLSESGPAEAAWHFGPRALGLLHLDRALRGCPLDFRLAVSSLAAVLGGIGYAAYAASHSYLDAFAQASAGEEGWLSVGWDLWRIEEGELGGIDNAAVSADLAGLAMTPAEGAEVFRRALAAATVEHVVVSTADLPARLARSTRRAGGRREAEDKTTAKALHPRPQLATPYAPPETELERQIAGLWERMLGFEPVGIDDNFFEMGGDSFVAIRMAAELRGLLGREIQVARLYQGLTIRALAQLLAEDAGEASEQRAAQLAERRDTMNRRREFQQSRRTDKRLRG